MKKAIAGIITYLIGMTLLLIAFVEAVGKIIMLAFLGLTAVGLLFFMYWLILQLLDNNEKNQWIDKEIKKEGKRGSSSRRSF